MRCASCGLENPADMSFCGKCGTSLSPSCPQCGFANSPAFAFCGKCGSPLTAPVTVPSKRATNKAKPPQQVWRDKHGRNKGKISKEPRRAASEAERRQLTVMFCDVVGSTALSAQLDPDEVRGVSQ